MVSAAPGTKQVHKCVIVNKLKIPITTLFTDGETGSEETSLLGKVILEVSVGTRIWP